MPDIFAVYDSHGLEKVDLLLEKVEAILTTGPNQYTAKHVGKTCAAINVLKSFSSVGDQPFFDGDSSALVDGAFFGNRPIADIVRTLVSKDPQALRALNGQFNALILPTKSNDLTVITDRLGSRPIYHAQLGSKHVISSEIKAIQAASERAFHVSPIGLLELFALGHNVGDRTILEEVTVLPPGSIITIDANGLHQTQYFQFAYRQATKSVSAQKWGERVSSCLKTVIPKYLVGEARRSIFLSGGLDSRIVAGAIGAAGGTVHAYTFGDPRSQEVRSACEIASRLRFPHKALTFPKNYLSAVLPRVVSRTECVSPFYHTTSPVFHDHLAEDTDVILVGFGGSLSGSQLGRGVLQLSSRDELGQYLLNRKLCAAPQDISRIFQPSFFNAHWGETIKGFHASVTQIEEENTANAADVWELGNRQRRFTFAAPKVDRGRFEVIAPMLDIEYVDLMTSLPIEARWKQLAYRHAITDGFPELRDIPWAKTGRKVPSGHVEFWADESLRIGTKVLSRGLGKYWPGGKLQKDKYRSVADDIRDDACLKSKYLDTYLAEGVLSEDVFSHAGIALIVERHMKGEDLSHLIGTILTVACYLSISGPNISTST